MLTVDGYSRRDQPIMQTKFGGIAFATETFDASRTWGYTVAHGAAEIGRMYPEMMQTVTHIALFSGVCYTQFADTFQEVNGLLCADSTPKIPLEQIALATQASRTHNTDGV